MAVMILVAHLMTSGRWHKQFEIQSRPSQAMLCRDHVQHILDRVSALTDRETKGRGLLPRDSARGLIPEFRGARPAMPSTPKRRRAHARLGAARPAL